MSWIFGASGFNNKELYNKIRNFIPEPLYEFTGNNLFVFAGGNAKTCINVKDNRNEEQVVAVGVGIKNSEIEFDFLKANEWLAFSNEDQLKNLDGHYVIVKWNQNEIKIFTDKLGLRDIYIHRTKDNKILFSTRIDILLKIIRPKLHFKEFGSRWLLFNQLSSNSVFHDIDRISSGMKVIIKRDNNKISVNKNCWLPLLNGKCYSDEDFYNTLEQLIIFPSQKNQKISLSLSGGMDSRVLLSFLLKNNIKSWDTHTFGNKEHPDSLVVNKIVSSNNILHEQIDLPFPDITECLNEITEYVSETVVNNEASSILHLRSYKKLIGRDEIIIDGGFGEIWRREFFNRLLLTGNKALINKNPGEIIPYLKYHRADIFTDEVNSLMRQGCEEQLGNIFEEFPDIEKIGVENWIDLFAIKTRMTNYYSHEQARVDSKVSSYMPFVQPTLLENVFRLNIKHRKNGKLFRDVIDRNFKYLKQYPIAKGQLTHPFRFNTIMSRVWNIAAKKLNIKIYNDLREEKLIKTLAPFILDSINSSAVKECSFYNYNRLLTLSNALSKKELSKPDMHELNWWLSFELFTQHNKI